MTPAERYAWTPVRVGTWVERIRVASDGKRYRCAERLEEYPGGRVVTAVFESVVPVGREETGE